MSVEQIETTEDGYTQSLLQSMDQIIAGKNDPETGLGQHLKSLELHLEQKRKIEAIFSNNQAGIYVVSKTGVSASNQDMGLFTIFHEVTEKVQGSEEEILLGITYHREYAKQIVQRFIGNYIALLNLMLDSFPASLSGEIEIIPSFFVNSDFINFPAAGHCEKIEEGKFQVQINILEFGPTLETIWKYTTTNKPIPAKYKNEVMDLFETLAHEITHAIHMHYNYEEFEEYFKKATIVTTQKEFEEYRNLNIEAMALASGKYFAEEFMAHFNFAD